MSYTLEELHEAQWEDMNNKIKAARKDLIKALWPDPANKPPTADNWDLPRLITTVRMRIEADRYYLRGL